MKKRIRMIVAGLSILILVIMPSMAAGEEPVIPGSVERDIVLRLAGIPLVTNAYSIGRKPNPWDQLETYYEKGDSKAVREITGVLLDLIFEYTHPRIKLDYITWSVPAGKRQETLMAAIADGTAPSIIIVPDLYTYAEEGILADITDYVKEWNGFKDLPKAAWDQARVGDKYYAFPGMQEYEHGFTYRRPYFKEAGIFNAAGEAAPPDNWTMEDFLEISRKVADPKKDRYFVSVAPRSLPDRPLDQANALGPFGDFGVKPDPSGKYTWRADFDTPGNRYFEWLG